RTESSPVLALPAVPVEDCQLPGSDLLRALRSEYEQDRVGDVALAGAVRAGDGRVPLEERDRDLSPERLEVLHLDLFQKQGTHLCGGRSALGEPATTHPIYISLAYDESQTR